MSIGENGTEEYIECVKYISCNKDLLGARGMSCTKN